MIYKFEYYDTKYLFCEYVDSLQVSTSNSSKVYINIDYEDVRVMRQRYTFQHTYQHISQLTYFALHKFLFMQSFFVFLVLFTGYLIKHMSLIYLLHDEDLFSRVVDQK